MPQINDYQPETNAQGAVGGVTPNLEAVSLFGRGVEHVGAALSEVGDVLHRRQAQQEVSQVYGQFAQARADWNVKLKQRLRDGTLDPDKFDQEYADYVNKAGDGLQTAEGKDFFNRQANRLGGTLMQNAIVGKARVAGEQAFKDISDGVNVHVANLKTHPEQVDDAIGSTEELIAAKQKNGTIDPEQAIRLQKQLLPQLAMASLTGLADKDQGVNEKGQPNPNLAKQSLDAGHFAEYLNEPQRTAMYNYARTAEARKESDAVRAETTAHRVLQAQGLDYMDKISNQIMNGSYSLKNLNTAPLTLEQKMYVKHQVDSVNKDDARTNKIDMSNAYKAILSNEITTREQLHQAVVTGQYQIAPHDVPFLEKQIDNTPDGLMIKGQIGKIDKLIDKQANSIKGIGGAPMVGALSVAADTRAELLHTEQLAMAGGMTRRQFWTNTDLKDPNSPYAILQRHQISVPEMMAMQAQQLQGQITGQGNATNINRYSNSPTKEVPPPQPAAAPQESAPPPQAPAPAPSGGMFDRMKDNRAGSVSDTLGLNESPEATAAHKSKEDKFAAEHPGYVQDYKRPPPTSAPAESKSPSESLRKPGESIEAYNKRLGIK